MPRALIDGPAPLWVCMSPDGQTRYYDATTGQPIRSTPSPY